MRRTLDKPEDMLEQAIRCEELARISGQAGDFATSAYFQREMEWFLKYAASIEG